MGVCKSISFTLTQYFLNKQIKQNVSLDWHVYLQLVKSNKTTINQLDIFLTDHLPKGTIRIGKQGYYLSSVSTFKLFPFSLSWHRVIILSVPFHLHPFQLLSPEMKLKNSHYQLASSERRPQQIQDDGRKGNILVTILPKIKRNINREGGRYYALSVRF